MAPSTRTTMQGIAVALAMMLCAGVAAKVPPEEAQKLKNGELTPFGADPKPNADGTIPAWTGGVAERAPGWKGPPEHYPDIFPNDKPLFTITAQNLDQYKDKLTPGQIAMFRHYPDTYKMPVYQTRRTFANPKEVYEWNYKNALNAELVDHGNGVKGAAVGIPFPIPKSGEEPIWNHKLRFRGESVRLFNDQAPVQTNGAYTIATLEENVDFPYNHLDMKPDDVGDVSIYFMQIFEAPPRLRGEVLLVHETIDQPTVPRRAWIYDSGLRRVRRAPEVGYDNPGSAADGLRTNDQLDMFNGGLDRYTWKLVGKKEIYVPYNAYKLHQLKHYSDFIRPGHPDMSLTRFELHRVWVVDSEVRPGTSHMYARRTFYIDEDSWQILLVDVYDRRGQIWRFQEAHGIQATELFPTYASVMETVYDLQSRRYLALQMNNEKPETTQDVKFPMGYFTTRNMVVLAPK